MNVKGDGGKLQDMLALFLLFFMCLLFSCFSSARERSRPRPPRGLKPAACSAPLKHKRDLITDHFPFPCYDKDRFRKYYFKEETA